jgi:hypothetical protein
LLDDTLKKFGKSFIQKNYGEVPLLPVVRKNDDFRLFRKLKSSILNYLEVA